MVRAKLLLRFEIKKIGGNKKQWNHHKVRIYGVKVMIILIMPPAITRLRIIGIEKT